MVRVSARICVVVAAACMMVASAKGGRVAAGAPGGLVRFIGRGSHALEEEVPSGAPLRCRPRAWVVQLFWRRSRGGGVLRADEVHLPPSVRAVVSLPHFGTRPPHPERPVSRDGQVDECPS